MTTIYERLDFLAESIKKVAMSALGLSQIIRAHTEKISQLEMGLRYGQVEYPHGKVFAEVYDRLAELESRVAVLDGHSKASEHDGLMPLDDMPEPYTGECKACDRVSLLTGTGYCESCVLEDQIQRRG